MSLQMALFHSFLWLSTLSVYHIFIHSSVAGHLCCFHVLAVVNSAVMKLVCMCHFKIWFSLDISSGMRLLDPMVVLYTVFKGSSILFSVVSCTSLHSQQQRIRRRSGTRASTLTTFIPHSFGSPSRSNQKERKSYWKERSIAVIVCR